MKQLFVPISLIVVLIVFFVIVDRKEFSSHDSVQTVQSESPTSNRKPTVSVPNTKPMTEVKVSGETKPVETKSVGKTNPVAEIPPNETKSTEAKFAAETIIKDMKPAETKSLTETTNTVETRHVEAKPTEAAPSDTETKTNRLAEVKPIVDIKDRKRILPAAVPVVTQEKAEKLNAFALFLSTVKTTVVEGEITERSELPDPKESDYPNCRYTAHFSGNSIISGEECPKEFVLVIEGFASYNILNENNVKQGDKIECSIIPFERLPTECQETQQADDLNLYLLERYYATDIRIIKSYNDNADFPKSGVFFSDREDEYVSIFDRQINPPLSQELNENQNSEILRTLKRMQSLLEDYSETRISEINRAFNETWEIEKRKDASGYNRVVYQGQKLVWRNIDNTFWSLPDNYTFLSQPINLSSDTLACFSALNKACKSNGVHFIVSFVPNCDVISARVINSQFNDIPDLQTATYVKQLSEKGIESVYCSDIIIHEYNRFPHAYMYPSDPHPADTAQDVITDILANKLRRYSLEQELEPDSEVFVKAYKDLVVWPDNCDIGNNQIGEPYEYRRVSCKASQSASKDAKIMLIGNSFVYSPINAMQSLLQYKLKSNVESYRMSGFAPFSEILFQLVSRPDFFLKGKKVLIMQVGTEHLTAANNRNIMLNVEHIDEDRLLLNGRKKITQLFSREINTDNECLEKWGNLIIDKRNIIKIGSDRQVEVLSIDLGKEQSLDLSKDLILVIPSTCSPNSSCILNVNGQRKKIPSSNAVEDSKWYNLCFSVSAGTTDITIKPEGAPGTAFAIKDIQIWQ